MLEGGRRQLPASLLPLFSWLCSLSSDKVAGRTSSSISDSRDYLPYIDAEIPQPAWSHCSMAIPMSLFLYAFLLFHYLLPGQDFLPKDSFLMPHSPSLAAVSSLPLVPSPLLFPQLSELGIQHRSEGRDGCALLMHSWHVSHQKLVASILSQTPQFLFSWMPIIFSGKEKVFFSWGIRFQTQTKADSAQCRKLSIGFYLFLHLWLQHFQRISLGIERHSQIFKSIGNSSPKSIRTPGFCPKLWDVRWSERTGGSWTAPVCHAKRLGLVSCLPTSGVPAAFQEVTLWWEEEEEASDGSCVLASL